MPLLSTKRILAGSALLLLSSTSAFAVDAQAFGERLQTALKQQGITLSFAGVEEVGNDVVVTGAAFALRDDAAPAGDLRFENVTGSSQQGFKAERLPLASFGKEGVGTAWRASNVSIEGIQIAGTDAAATTPLPTALYFERLAFDEFATSRGGKNDFALRGTEVVNAVDQAGNVTTTLNLGEFEVDLSLHEPTDFLNAIGELGYAKFSGSASGKASWDPRNGRFAISPFRFGIKDAGSFEFSTAISGATREFGHSLGRFMADDDRSDVAILGPVANLSLERYEILIEDASLGGRLVDFYADLTHLPREGVLEYSAQILASLLRDLENQGFQNAIGSAVSELLKDPQSKSIALSITPKDPVPGVLILATALGSPERLPDLLGAQVQTVPRANPARAAEADPQPKAGGGTASAAGAAAGKAAGDAAAGGTGGTVGAAMEKQGKAATGEARRKVP